jgi:hypothetical protein
MAAYNNAVMQWPSVKQDFAARGPFQATIDNALSLNATTSTALEQGTIESGSGISFFDPSDRLEFSTYSSPFAASPNVPSTGGNSARTLTVKDANGVTLFTKSVTLVFSNSYTRSKKSSCAYGKSTGSTSCIVYMYPNGAMCLTVDQKGGSWGYGGGCAVFSESTADASTYGSADPQQNTAPARYGDVTYSYASTSPATFYWPNNLPSSGYAITVRSNMDPYAVAVQATGGYMVFGARSAALWKKGSILMGVGVGLFSPFLLAALVLCCCAFKDSRGCSSGCGCGECVEVLGACLTCACCCKGRTSGTVIASPAGGDVLSAATIPGPKQPVTFTKSIRMRFDYALERTAAPLEVADNGLRTMTRGVVRTMTRRQRTAQPSDTLAQPTIGGPPPQPGVYPDLPSKSPTVSSPPPMYVDVHGDGERRASLAAYSALGSPPPPQAVAVAVPVPTGYPSYGAVETPTQQQPPPPFSATL